MEFRIDLFIADRASPITNAFNSEFPGVKRSICYFHVKKE